MEDDLAKRMRESRHHAIKYRAQLNDMMMTSLVTEMRRVDPVTLTDDVMHTLMKKILQREKPPASTMERRRSKV